MRMNPLCHWQVRRPARARYTQKKDACLLAATCPTRIRTAATSAQFSKNRHRSGYSVLLRPSGVSCRFAAGSVREPIERLRVKCFFRRSALFSRRPAFRRFRVSLPSLREEERLRRRPASQEEKTHHSKKTTAPGCDHRWIKAVTGKADGEK